MLSDPVLLFTAEPEGPGPDSILEMKATVATDPKEPQQPTAHQDAHTRLPSASKEGTAGSPGTRVTRSSARALHAQRRHHPYKRPTAAAAPTAAPDGPAMQRRPTLRRQQCDAQVIPVITAPAILMCRARGVVAMYERSGMP